MHESQMFILVRNKNIKYFAGGQCMKTEPPQTCPNCKLNRTRDWNSSHVDLELSYLGRGFEAYLWNSHGLYLLREDVIESWKSAGISGYKLGEVFISGWYENQQRPLPKNIPDYKSVIPTSSVRLSQPPPTGEPCPVCGLQSNAFPKVTTKLTAGIKMLMENWNGNDIVSAGRTGFILCTEKVVLSTLKAGFGNHIGFVRSEKFLTWDEFDIHKRSPQEYEKYKQGFIISQMKDLNTK